LACAGGAFLLAAGCGHAPPSPDDPATVTRRLDDLERRVAELEDAKPPAARDTDRAADEGGEPATQAGREPEGGRLPAHGGPGRAKGMLEAEQIVVTIDGEGLRLEGRAISRDELRAVLRKRVRKNDEVSFLLRSTSDVPDATVAELVDLARAMGIRRFALATIPSD